MELRRRRCCGCKQPLGRNPNLSGRVDTRFVIGKDGAVRTVSIEDSTELDDRSALDCIRAVYEHLCFPLPMNGEVTVTYPIMFSPG